MEILSSSSMAEADRLTIQETGIPSAVLMENAAAGVFDYISSLEIPKDRIAITAGCGNNGGDGFALARRLANADCIVDVFVCQPEKLKGDAKLNYDILLKFPVSIIELDDEAPLFDSYDITVDALFGTGFKGEITGFYAALIESVNETSNFVISIDIPSGLSGSSHNVSGICVDADATVTFCRPKIPPLHVPRQKNSAARWQWWTYPYRTSMLRRFLTGFTSLRKISFRGLQKESPIPTREHTDTR
ncbi:MAG: NAD(P)H-hydrate epimerase [Geovibrio sp.]|nr:NAD(P)H-hydrate epimerase [Geovibrio sp.]